MSHDKRDVIPILELKLPSSTSPSVPWSLKRIVHWTPFTATDLMPSSTHDTSLTQFVKEPSPWPYPPGMSLPSLVLYALIPTKINPSSCLYATWMSSTNSNLCFNFQDTDYTSSPLWSPTGACSESWPLTISSLNSMEGERPYSWNGIAPLILSLWNFLSKETLWLLLDNTSIHLRQRLTASPIYISSVHPKTQWPTWCHPGPQGCRTPD